MIIFINGSINSGKTTLSKILAEKLGKVALVEVDHLHGFIEWMPIDQAVPINLENAVAIVKNFVKRNIDVVMPYPLSIQDYEYLLENLKEYKDAIHIFTLAPKLETALKNRGSRDLTDWEIERIKHHYATGISKPEFGIIIDSTHQTPTETADQILKLVRG